MRLIPYVVAYVTAQGEANLMRIDASGEQSAIAIVEGIGGRGCQAYSAEFITEIANERAVFAEATIRR